MKYLDLFAGYGGFSLGIQQAYEEMGQLQSPFQRPDNSWNTETQWGRPECIGFSEIDKYAIQIYQKHFPNHKSYGDITKLDPATLPDFDLLTGGFPCQAFSIAGKRGGFNDTRGTLIYDVFRILKEKQPRLCLLENVKGLLSHDQGRTFKTIITSLNELGYAVEWQVLNAKNFGVPQNRERVFIVGHLGGIPERKVFPIGESSGKNNDFNKKKTLTYQWDISGKGYDSQQDRAYDIEGVMATLPHTNPDNKLNIYAKNKTNTTKTLQILWEKIGKEAFYEWAFGRLRSFQEKEILQPNLYGVGLREETDKEKSEMDDCTLSRTEIEAERELRDMWNRKCEGCPPQKSRLERQFIDELAETLQNLPQQTTPFLIRRLTPIETERLMGLPDGWTEGGINNFQNICVNINPVIENQLPKSDTVCSIINDTKDTELQIYRSEKKENVCFVIDKPLHNDYAKDTINLGSDTVMLFNQKSMWNAEELIKKSHTLEKMGEKSTFYLWKIILDENLPKEKLSTILTSIREIMTNPTSIFAKIGKNTIGCIIRLNSQELKICEQEKRFVLRVANIVSVSDTQRYKLCGNGVVVNVVREIIKRLMFKIN